MQSCAIFAAHHVDSARAGRRSVVPCWRRAGGTERMQENRQLQCHRGGDGDGSLSRNQDGLVRSDSATLSQD